LGREQQKKGESFFSLSRRAGEKKRKKNDVKGAGDRAGGREWKGRRNDFSFQSLFFSIARCRKAEEKKEKKRGLKRGGRKVASRNGREKKRGKKEETGVREMATLLSC